MRTLGWVVLFFATAPLTAQLRPDDCSLAFAGSDRKPVKLRTLHDGSSYAVYNPDPTNPKIARPLTVQNFLKLACALDAKIPPAWRQGALSQAQVSAILGFENVKIGVAGYLLGVRFEANGDHDFHCEISDSPNWVSDHIVVEVPPGQAFCDARTFIWNLVKQDAQKSGRPAPTAGWVFHHPPHVHVYGFPMWDLFHGRLDTCHANGNRGIRFGNNGSQVKGLWEVHPVLGVTLHEDPGPWN